MNYNLSACVFIRNTFDGAFCLFESMHQLLPLVNEFIIMDMGSTDGTLETLEAITKTNPKIKLIEETGFSHQDASVFADIANDLIKNWCNYPNVLYYQADEIWHEDLIKLMIKKFDEGIFDLSFWRIQYCENFQKVKWFPHPVHRVGAKDNFHFTGDGMNTDRVFGTEMCSTYNMGWFTRWGEDFEDNPIALPTNEMILDVSLTGGFLENIPERRKMHIPFWNEDTVNIHMTAKEDSMLLDDWIKIQRDNKNWYLQSTPFNIPEIMKWHLGRVRYELRPELLSILKDEEWR